MDILLFSLARVLGIVFTDQLPENVYTRQNIIQEFSLNGPKKPDLLNSEEE
jgi:hypothetical protein